MKSNKNVVVTGRSAAAAPLYKHSGQESQKAALIYVLYIKGVKGVQCLHKCTACVVWGNEARMSRMRGENQHGGCGDQALFSEVETYIISFADNCDCHHLPYKI